MRSKPKPQSSRSEEWGAGYSGAIPSLHITILILLPTGPDEEMASRRAGRSASTRVDNFSERDSDWEIISAKDLPVELESTASQGNGDSIAERVRAKREELAALEEELEL